MPASPPCRSDAAYTGVWREGRKLCAIGIGCSRWHTTHGLALNLDVDLQAYDSIVPCGIQEQGRAVGNVRAEVEQHGQQAAASQQLQWGDAGMQRAQQAVAEEISRAFGYELQVERGERRGHAGQMGRTINTRIVHCTHDYILTAPHARTALRPAAARVA